jgi:hypothetical protein
MYEVGTHYTYDFTGGWKYATDLEAYRDEIADIDYRFVISPGIKNVLRDDKAYLDIGLGLAYLYESVSKETDWALGLRLSQASRLDLEIMSLWQKIVYYPSFDDLADFIVDAEIGMETKINKKQAIGLTLKNKYDNIPATGKSKNDVIVLITWSYSF